MLWLQGHWRATKRPRNVHAIKNSDVGEWVRLMSMAQAARRALPALHVGDDDAAALKHGVRVAIDAADGGPFAVFGPDGSLLCVSDVRHGRLDHRLVVAG